MTTVSWEDQRHRLYCIYNARGDCTVSLVVTSLDCGEGFWFPFPGKGIIKYALVCFLHNPRFLSRKLHREESCVAHDSNMERETDIV